MADEDDGDDDGRFSTLSVEETAGRDIERATKNSVFTLVIVTLDILPSSSFLFCCSSLC